MLSVAAASSRCCLGDRGFIALGLLTIRTPCALTPASHSGQDLHTFHFSIGCDGSNLDLGHRNTSSWVQWKRRSVVPACLHAEPGSCRSRRCESLDRSLVEPLPRRAARPEPIRPPAQVQ